MAGLAAELTRMAERYPELADFPKYYESLEDKLRIRFDSGMKPINTKRYVRPDDFERHGISLQFDLCDENLPCTPTIHATTRHFKNLHLQLYAEVNLSSSPSPGLREEFHALMARYISLIEEVDAQAAKILELRPNGASGSTLDNVKSQ